jgi:ferrous iron transport protein A
MPSPANRKEMSVVLVACSPVYGAGEKTVHSTLATEAGQAFEATASTTQPTPLVPLPTHISSDEVQASLRPRPDQRPTSDTQASHQQLDQVARDIRARGNYGSVVVSYCQGGDPSVEEAVERAIGGGARWIVVVPMVFSLAGYSPCERLPVLPLNTLRQQVTQIQARHPGVTIVHANPQFGHEHQVDLFLSVIREYEPATVKKSTCHLNDLATGESALVLELDGGTHFRGRMASLGFTPGATVKMIQNYGHGAVIVSLRGTRVALGRGEARKVGITRHNDQGQSNS